MLERLRSALVAEPVYISLILRWFGWFVALVIVLCEAAPRANLENAPFVLVVTAVVLILMSIFPSGLRKFLPLATARLTPALWPLFDGVIALWSIYATGGWDSPFYHFAVTAVLAPSLRFGLVGALLSSTLFSLGFIAIIKLTTFGFSPAYSDTQAEPDLVSSPLNPVMIALYAAFLGEVLKKLRIEMDRSQKLAAENERQRMARDIHDGVSQTLFMLAMSLETGQVLAQKESAEKTAQHLEKLTPVAQKALIELRNAMYNVEPLADGKQTLQEAVQQLARDYRSASGKSIEFEAGEPVEVPPALASMLFHMTQEALSNACQHSGADRVEIKMQGATLSVRDNGRGFDMSTVKRGRGLGNLEKRANEANVELSVESGPRGTRLSFRWVVR